MGKKQDFTSSEKDEVVRLQGKECQHCKQPKTSSEIIGPSNHLLTTLPKFVQMGNGEFAIFVA